MSKTMTLEDARTTADKLAAEFNIFFSDKRTKAGSQRIRKYLGELKNATPELRRKLVAADQLG